MFRRVPVFSLILTGVMVTFLAPGLVRGQGLIRFETGPCQGSSGAVRIDQLPLVFSTQLFPASLTGNNWVEKTRGHWSIRTAPLLPTQGPFS